MSKLVFTFQIGEYDSDDGELWDDNDSDSDEEGNLSGESWETESEHSVKDIDSSVNFNMDMDDSNMRSKLAASIERARIAITKLENTYNDKTGKSPSQPIAYRQMMKYFFRFDLKIFSISWLLKFLEINPFL